MSRLRSEHQVSRRESRRRLLSDDMLLSDSATMPPENICIDK
jgi:hypothetical protein